MLGTPSVFTSNVSVTSIFRRASRLRCDDHWQRIPQSDFPTGLQFLPGGVLGSVVSVNALAAFVRSINNLYNWNAVWHSASLRTK